MGVHDDDEDEIDILGSDGTATATLTVPKPSPKGGGGGGGGGGEGKEESKGGEESKDGEGGIVRIEDATSTEKRCFAIGFRSGAVRVDLRDIQRDTSPTFILDIMQARWLIRDSIAEFNGSPNGSDVDGAGNETLLGTLRQVPADERGAGRLLPKQETTSVPARKLVWVPDVYLQKTNIRIINASGHSCVKEEWSHYRREVILTPAEQLEEKKKQQAEARRMKAARAAKLRMEQELAEEAAAAALKEAIKHGFDPSQSELREPQSSCPTRRPRDSEFTCEACWYFEAVVSACIEIPPPPRPPSKKPANVDGTDANNTAEAKTGHEESKVVPLNMTVDAWNAVVDQPHIEHLLLGGMDLKAGEEKYTHTHTHTHTANTLGTSDGTSPR